MSATDIKSTVLKANQEAHDSCAPSHTRAVPYQSRPNTRKYIWDMVINQLNQTNIKLPNAKVLEVACGTGTFVDLFKKLGTASYTGMDLSGEMIKFAKMNHPDTTFHQSSLEDFYAQHANEYDIIISSSFLHHLVDMEEGLKQIKSMLKPGGIYIALHEVVVRETSKIEKFDDNLSKLFGYQGHIRFPLTKRIKSFLRVYPFFRIILGNKRSNHQHHVTGVDYVDYQLNFDFNLQTNDVVKKYGTVIPYCYYSFIEFRHLKHIDNHHMLVMRKGESE